LKKLLYITKNFPPEIGGGLRRIEAIYKLLKENKNIQLYVVTTTKDSPGVYGEDVKYIKQLFFKDREMFNNVSFKSSKSSIKLIDKAFAGWMPNVLLHIIFKKFDYVFCSVPSFTNALIGFFYKILSPYNPRLIIDYRDFLSFNPSYVENFKKKIIRFIEKLVIKSFEFIIVTTNGMKNIIQNETDRKNVFLVRNYMGELDINLLKNIKCCKFDKSYYHLGYIGKLNTGRNPENILGLLNKKIDNKKVMIHFIGTTENLKKSIIGMAKESGLDIDRLNFTGVVSREDSLKYMKSFEGVLLIINNDVKIKDGYGIPGKLYDYIHANNNIFADRLTVNNLSDEFNIKIKRKYDDIYNIEFTDKTALDSVFNKVISEIIR